MTRWSRIVLMLQAIASVPVAAQSHAWRADDRVVLRDFSDVRVMALTGAGLFVGTRGGLIIYDTRTHRWLPPVTELDGLPTGELLTAIGDPADETLWLGMSSGLVHYLPVLREVQVFPTNGAVVRLGFDERDPFRGIYLATKSGWWFLPRGGGLPTPSGNLPSPEQLLAPLTVEEVLQREPAADANRSYALLDARLRQFEYTAVAEDHRRREFYFGTNGAGVFRYDPATVEFTAMPFGLPSDRIGAALWRDGQVWIGTGGRDGRVGFGTVESALQQFTWDEGDNFGGYDFSDVRALEPWHDAIWAATDRGLFRADRPGEAPIRGLPSNNVFAMAPGQSGLWVGTARGIAVLRYFDHAGFVIDETQLTTAPVLALATEGHDIWIGTTAGLRLLRGEAEGIETPGATQDVAALTDAVVGIAVVGDKLFAATLHEVVWRDSAEIWYRAPSVSIGQITMLASDSEGVWIGGEDGIARLDVASGGIRTVAGRGELPGRVRGIEAGGGFVWVATDRGLVRLRQNRVAR